MEIKNGIALNFFIRTGQGTIILHRPRALIQLFISGKKNGIALFKMLKRIYEVTGTPLIQLLVGVPVDEVRPQSTFPLKVLTIP